MKKVFLGAAVSMLAIFTACNKEEGIIPEVDYMDPDMSVTVESIVTTEASVDDVMEAADYEVDLFSGSADAYTSMAAEVGGDELKSGGLRNRYKYRYRWQKCPLITIESAEGGFPKTITLDYGESTELENGRIIKGIVQIVLSDSPRVDGATRTVTFQDFSIDEVGISGTNVKTFNGDNQTERIVNISRDMLFTFTDGTTLARTAEKTRTWTAGLDTPLDHSDDVMEITGYTNCEDSDENTYRREITKALVKRGDCRFIVSGEVTLSKNGAVFATIDYGTGECDRMATMTTSEGTKEIEIGKRKRERKQEQNNS